MKRINTNHFKKVNLIVLLATLTATLVACGGGDKTTTVSQASTPTATTTAGQAAYLKAFNGQSCAGCHGTFPNFKDNVMSGANNAAKIRNAINNNVGDMRQIGPIDGSGGISTQEINDIAAYLAASF